MKRKKTKEKEAVRYPVHKMGKFYGYDEYEDGSIELAPALYEIIDNALIAKQSINSILKAVTSHLQEMQIPVEKSIQNFWDKVRDEYGIDYERYEWRYDGQKKRLTRQEKPKPKEAPNV